MPDATQLFAALQLYAQLTRKNSTLPPVEVQKNAPLETLIKASQEIINHLEKFTNSSAKKPSANSFQGITKYIEHLRTLLRDPASSNEQGASRALLNVIQMLEKYGPDNFATISQAQEIIAAHGDHETKAAFNKAIATYQGKFPELVRLTIETPEISPPAPKQFGG